MHFKFKYLDKLVGGFFILILICLLGLIVIVARGQKWFADYSQFHSYFSKGGLNVGDVVLINGMDVGHVSKVELDEDNRVLVDYKVYSKFADRIKEGTKATISAPIVGSAKIVLNLGPMTNKTIDVKSEIPSAENETASLDKLIESATGLINTLKDPDGDLMKMFANLEKSTAELKQTMAGRGALGGLMTDSELSRRLNTTVKHLEGVMESLDDASPDITAAIISARKNLEEAQKVINALQKSFLLRGNIEQYTGGQKLLTGAEGGIR